MRLLFDNAKRSSSPRRGRPLNVLATLGTAGHNGFERWAGVGVVLEPWIGRRATNLLWGVVHPFSLWRSLAGREGDNPLLAFNAGISIAGVLVHFVEWPWSRRLGFLPWLDAAEGFEPNLMLPYNTILWVWMIGGVGSALFETRRPDLKYVAAGIATAPVLLASARHHFAWAAEQAEAGNPAFTAALLGDSPRRRVGTQDHQ